MIWKALVKSFDYFLRFLDCPEMLESEVVSEQCNVGMVLKHKLEVLTHEVLTN